MGRWRWGGAVMQERCPRLLTSAAFFSASSSFSWASLRASEYLSNSSSVPFNFFCRATRSSSSWGRFRWRARVCHGWSGRQEEEEGRVRARRRESDRDRRTKTHGDARHSGQDRTGQDSGKREEREVSRVRAGQCAHLSGGLLRGQQLLLGGLELLKHFISLVLSNAQFLFHLSYIIL